MEDNYLLTTELSRRLYREVARPLPLIDYHNHLNVSDLAQDRQFEDIAQVWLLGDPYKHRAMRICGVDEEYITGSASRKEKFRAWCETYPKLIGGPLHDWSRLELKKVFGIELEINGENADAIWDEANAKLRLPEFSARGLYNSFNIEYAAPCASLLDDMAPFAAIEGLAPSLRADDLLALDQATVKKLEGLTGLEIKDAESLHSAVAMRLDVLHEAGCRFSDHALDNGFVYIRDDEGFRACVERLVRGEALSKEERRLLVSGLLLMLSGEYAKRGWTMQMHIGAQRSTSKRLLDVAGPASGLTCIGNSLDVAAFAAMLNDFEQGEHGLCKTLLFSLNPADNPLLAVLSGSFIGVSQGPAWWWCDHLQGMREMLEYFSTFSVLSTFVGMTTDSRSLLSMLRHDYFRRLLCGWLGEKAQRGEVPDSFEKLSGLVRAVCYENAKNRI